MTEINKKLRSSLSPAPMINMVKMMLIPMNIRWILSWLKVVPIWRHIGV